MKRIVGFFIVVSFMFSSCGQEEAKYSIPWARVSFLVNYNQDPELQDLQGFKVFTRPRLGAEYVGLGGLLVVHGIGDGRPMLHAYDLACPNEGLPSVKVESKDGMTAKCNKCGAVFDIFNGTGRVVSGSATERLQKYRVGPTDSPDRFRIEN